MRTEPTHTDLYSEITEALEDYSRELTDVLDHVTDAQEIESYGRKSENLYDLRLRWIRHAKDRQKHEHIISVRDEDGLLRDEEDLACTLLEAHRIESGPLYRDPDDPPGHFRIPLTEKETDDITEEDAWAGSKPFTIEVHTVTSGD